MFQKFKEMYYKHNAKSLEKVTYTKYKIQITYKNDTVEEWKYNKYCLFDKNDIIEYFMSDGKNKSMIIKNGSATPVCDIKEIKSIPVNTVELYFSDELISDWKHTWMDTNDIKSQQEKMEE